LSPGQRPETRNVILRNQELPETLRTYPAKRVLDHHRWPQSEHILGAVDTTNAPPPWRGLPLLLQLQCFLGHRRWYARKVRKSSTCSSRPRWSTSSAPSPNLFPGPGPSFPSSSSRIAS